MKKYLSLLLSIVMLISTFAVGTISASATIPSDARKYNNHYYRVYSTSNSITWKDAKKKCEEKGGHLVTITSSKEDDFVSSMIKGSREGIYYIGAYDKSYTSKKWNPAWVTNEKYSYSNWAPDEPYGQSGKAFYSGIWEDSHEWVAVQNDANDSDIDCFGYICEWEYNVKLSESKVVMNIGQKRTIEYTVKGGTQAQKNKTPSWSSSNTEVAKVSSKGMIVAMGVGTCLVTCKVGSAKKSVRVVVRPKQVKNFGVQSKNRNEITFKWSKQNKVTGYKIYMYDKDIQEYTCVKTVNGAFKSGTVKNLKRGRTYKFKIRSYYKYSGKFYYGGFSKVITVKTKK